MRTCLFYSSILFCVVSCSGNEEPKLPSSQIIYDKEYNDEVNRGLAELNSGNAEEALRIFNDLLLSDSTDAKVLRYRGEAFSKLRQFDSAIADYTTCLQLETNRSRQVDIYNLRANAYLDKGMYSEGLSDLNKSISMNSDTVFNYAFETRATYEQLLSSLGILDSVLEHVKTCEL